jgi:hypothetical protein
MELVAVVLATAWAGGTNSYLTVLALGLLGRLGDVALVPDVLVRTEVLVVAAALAAVEAVVDKVPYLDTAWDGLSTLVRPVAGATLAVLLAEGTGEALLTTATLGGAVALAAHAVKAGVRVMVNSSPGPARTTALSWAEDAAVVVVVVLLAVHPGLALAVAAGCFLAGLAVVVRTFLALVQERRGPA